MYDIIRALTTVMTAKGLLGCLNNLRRKKKLKGELWKALRIPYRDLQNSLNNCIEKFYTIFGAASLSVHGMYPKDRPRVRAKKYVQDLEKSINDLVQSLERTTVVICTHRESFREISEPDQQMMLDILVEQTKGGKIDLSSLLQYPYIQEKLKEIVARKENTFSRELTKEVKRLNKKLNIDWLEKKILEKCGLTDVKDIQDIFQQIVEELSD